VTDKGVNGFIVPPIFLKRSDPDRRPAGQTFTLLIEHPDDIFEAVSDKYSRADDTDDYFSPLALRL
jgi:hypothetical protein